MVNEVNSGPSVEAEEDQLDAYLQLIYRVSSNWFHLYIWNNFIKDHGDRVPGTTRRLSM